MTRINREALVEEVRNHPAYKSGKYDAFFEELVSRIQGETPPVADAPDKADLASWIDHTQLRPEALPEEIRALCEESRRFGFASVCIHPSFVPLASDELDGSDVAVCTVIGFPLGATLSSVKRSETEVAIQAGAEEVDMVLPIGVLKSGDLTYVEEDIQQVVQAAEDAGDEVLVKVILETALLSDAEKAIACLLCEQAGADFVKTSTGFASGGAKEADVALMHQIVGDRLGIKASGGIRSADDAIGMINVGATRLGASGSVEIMEGTLAEDTY